MNATELDGSSCSTSFAGVASAAAPTGQDEEAAISNRRRKVDRSISVHSFAPLLCAVLLFDEEAAGHSVVRGFFVLFMAACRSRRNSASLELRALLVAFTTEWYAASSCEVEKA